MLSEDMFNRIEVLRFPLVAGVVLAHSYPGTLDSLAAVYVYNFFGQGLVRVSVPLLFLISGFLMFLRFEPTKEAYLLKCKSRLKTLLIPFLVWNSATLLIIALAQQSSLTSSFFSGANMPIASYKVKDVMNAILGIGRMPVAMQFWFVRDLMLLVLVTPMVAYAGKVFPKFCMLLLLACWLFEIWPLPAPSVEASLFFAAGAFAAQWQKNIFLPDKWGRLLFCIFIAELLIYSTLTDSRLAHYLHKIALITGVPAVLMLSKYVVSLDSLKNRLLALSPSSFFVFAAHEPLQTIIRKVAYRLLMPESAFLTLSLYFLLPAAVICLLVKIFLVLEELAPDLLKIVNGQRTRKVPCRKRSDCHDGQGFLRIL